MRMVFFFLLNSNAEEKRNRDRCVVIRAHVELNLSKGMMAGKSENKQMNSELEIMPNNGRRHRAWEKFSHTYGTDERYPYGPVKLLMNTLIILLC